MNNLNIEKEQLASLAQDPGAGGAFVPISFAGTCSTHFGGDYCPLGPGEPAD
jgi:hypothetical protein